MEPTSTIRNCWSEPSRQSSWSDRSRARKSPSTCVWTRAMTTPQVDRRLRSIATFRTYAESMRMRRPPSAPGSTRNTNRAAGSLSGPWVGSRSVGPSWCAMTRTHLTTSGWSSSPVHCCGIVGCACSPPRSRRAFSDSYLFLAQINVRDLDQVHDLQLFSDTGMHYLALNRPTTLQKELVGPVWPGVGANIRTAAVNGKIYAFDRTSSKVRWYANIANQVLVLDQFNKMGILLFAARFNRPMNQMDNLVITVKSVDKRSGKLLFEKEYPFQGNLFNVITDNSRRGSVELVRQDLKIVHSS